MKNFYSIGEVAKILNISTSKLRYYDKNDIISPEIRKENGYRYYSEKQIVLLKKISLAKRREKFFYTPRIEYFDNIYRTKIIDEIKVSEECFMLEEFLRKIDEYEENIRLNIVKKDFKDLGNKEITGKIYVVLDQKNNEEEIVINSGDYATISSIGHFDGEEGRKVLLELLSWIKENKILILDEKVYILFETEIINIKENVYKLAIRVKK